MNRRYAALIVSLALAPALSACGGKAKPPVGRTATTQSTAAASAPSPAPPATTRGPTSCQRVPKPRPKSVQLPKPSTSLDPAHSWSAVVQTSCGNITIALDVKQAPRTAASFAYLARRGFYDGTTFDRIVPGFIIQGGDPSGTGMGDAGYSVVETPPSSLQYVRGVVAMAKGGVEDPGTSGSQFFVVTGPDAQLPPEYALVGRVTSGLDAIDRIGTEPTDQSNPDPALREQPLRPVVIRRVTIREGG